jgi:short-subunit dehydrogenase involved in D-alanine esterification of teichoic acids
MEGFKVTPAEEALFQEIGLGNITITETRQNLLNRIEKQQSEEPGKFIDIPPELDIVFVNDVYPKTNFLVNNLGINNWDLLQEAERNLTGFRMIEQWRDPIPGEV